MIEHQPPQKKAQAGSRQTVYLLLAGGGILLALALIVVGAIIFLVWRSQSTAVTGTPPPSPTVQAAIETPAAAVTIGVEARATATPTITAARTQVSQTGETVGRLPTATRLPTPTPTPSTASGVARLDGTIELVSPTHDTHVPGETVEFQWIWHPRKGCLPPPDGFAFEIRIWQDVDNAPPMGAMDAGAEKTNIRCDPNTGIRAFTIGKLHEVPGAAGQPDGRLRWDVALVQISPYKPVITTQYRTFFY